MTGMVSLPPEWTDCASEAREDIKHIREKLVQLAKMQQKRLLKVFVDDAAPDKDVEQCSIQISGLIRRCICCSHRLIKPDICIEHCSTSLSGAASSTKTFSSLFCCILASCTNFSRICLMSSRASEAQSVHSGGKETIPVI